MGSGTPPPSGGRPNPDVIHSKTEKRVLQNKTEAYQESSRITSPKPFLFPTSEYASDSLEPRPVPWKVLEGTVPPGNISEPSTP